MKEEWDPGLVRFVRIDSNGRGPVQEQMCWNKQRFINKQTELAAASQKEKKTKDRHMFELA